MKLLFFHSKLKEKEKLLNIYQEYQWFVVNDFPIVFPKFFSEIYQRNRNNKKLFAKELNRKLNKIYKKSDYQQRVNEVKNNWKKIERDFFNTMVDLKLKIKNEYVCNISLYGPSGQFKYPNIINLRTSNIRDIKEANKTIAHELIHLIIYNKVKKLKLNYQQTEGVVDLFFTDTKIKKLFPNYKCQSIAEQNKNLLKKVLF